MTTSLASVIGNSPVMVTGAGVSGTGTAQLLTGLGRASILVDDNRAALDAAVAASGATGVDTARAKELIDAHEVDLVVTSPGWRPDSELLTYARTSGLEVIGDVELVYRLDRAGVFGPPRTWLVITGTNGKTTTTAMLADIMVADTHRTGLRAQACGNIGVAVADAVSAEPRVDILVAELSSFQLHWSSELKPNAGVLLNLAEDHIDWHGSMANYAADKAKVLTGDIAVAGVDDEAVRGVMAQVRPDALGFTLELPQPGRFGVHDDMIVSPSGTELASTTGLQPSGPAGVYDALAAAAVATTQGVPAETIQSALASFTVAGHRGEVVVDGASTWIDNSKATNPHAADAALAGLTDVVWIAGGQLKGARVDDVIATHAHRLRAVGVLGVDRQIVVDAVRRLAPDVEVFVTQSPDPQQAMDDLASWAAGLKPAPTTVLLAPAGASLDMYSGMAQRGDLFAEAARRYDAT